MEKYKPTIGLEIHAELKTDSKMFCGCKNDPLEKRANFNVCEICSGHPGTLPVANEKALEMVIKTGLALNCQIAEYSKFDRKNYFYPDLPKGYQISQFDMPLCQNGFLQINGKKIRIKRIHIEEDTGSLLHPDAADYSLVNLNRAGVPLMELVTEPDIEYGKEAEKFAKELQLIFRYLGVSDADMEKGLMRVEVNISISKDEKLGTKVEIKNLNSFRVVQKAIDFEIKRQQEVLENGEEVKQETRGWNDKKEITFSQREKEEAHDYRYFPEPDLPPLNFTKEYIGSIKSSIAELPQQKRERFKAEYGLEGEAVEVFVNNKNLAEYFERASSELLAWMNTEKIKKTEEVYKILSNYLTSDVLGILQGKEFSEKEINITAENFGELIKMIYNQEISSKIAKQVLPIMVKTGGDPSDIVDENNWRQISDSNELEEKIKLVLEKNQKAVEDYKSGKENALQFLSGQVMAVTKGAADPKKVQEILKNLM